MQIEKIVDFPELREDFKEVAKATIMKRQLQSLRAIPSQHFQPRYLKDRSMLVERNFDFQLTGSDESLRFKLHGGSLHELEHRKAVREKLLNILRHSLHQWFTVEQLGVELKEASKFSASYSERAVRREMSQLYVEAAVTGVVRRRIYDGKTGRPKFEYAFVR